MHIHCMCSGAGRRQKRILDLMMTGLTGCFETVDVGADN